MDERLRFVARLLEGEKMAPLCAEFEISRETGYKIFDRCKDCGVQAFGDRSHRAHRQANRLPAPIEATIVRLKREYPGWGAPKIREKSLPQGIRTDNRVYRGLEELTYPFHGSDDPGNPLRPDLLPRTQGEPESCLCRPERGGYPGR